MQLVVIIFIIIMAGREHRAPWRMPRDIIYKHASMPTPPIHLPALHLNTTQIEKATESKQTINSESQLRYVVLKLSLYHLPCALVFVFVCMCMYQHQSPKRGGIYEHHNPQHTAPKRILAVLKTLALARRRSQN